VRGLLITLLFMISTTLYAQRGGGAQPQATARSAAPFDITGYWVSLVSDYWLLRMQPPAKADADDLSAVPLNPEGLRVAQSFDSVSDERAGERCKAYGAIGVMRMPTRLHITWETDSTLLIETDAGMQARRLHFGQPPAQAAPTLQGRSIAEWQLSGGRGGIPRGGQLKVTTTNMRPGYYFKVGHPYSGNARMTEHFVRLEGPRGESYLVLTQLVEDPQYLRTPYVRTWNFEREPDASKWNPSPCSVR
jgi:hypothetical protein